MCGIVGYILKDQESKALQSNLNNAIQSLAKRGPDARGAFYHHHCGLGHTRLSIIGLSEKGNQPMSDCSGRYTIIYNGEIYNYQALKKKLEHKHAFKSNTDTEVLLYLFIEYGVDCLEMLDGFFAFAIYDKEEETVFLARDRMGIKHLCYYQDEQQIIFSSELKGIFPFPIKKEIDLNALSLYFKFNYIPAPHAILKSTQKLLPGHFAVIKQHNITTRSYFSLPSEDVAVNDISYKEAKNILRDKLETSVQNRMISDVPLGSFLSGGIDSSIIAGIASKYNDKLKTFSIGYENSFYDESKFAELMAKQLQTDHTTFKLNKLEIAQSTAEVLKYMDEPFADSSIIPGHILSKYTQNEVKVALSGDGADELLAGYNKHRALYRFQNKKIHEQLALSLKKLWALLPKSRNNYFGNKIRQLHRFAQSKGRTNSEIYWLWCAIGNDEYVFNLLKSTVNNSINSTYTLTQDATMNDYLLMDQQFLLPNDMLYKVDRMSMANGLEVRTPFLDHKVVNFANSLPSQFKITAKNQKIILKDAFSDLLPGEILNRPKKGFEVPIESILKEELSSYINDYIADKDFIIEQGIFDYDYLQKLLKAFYSNDPNDTPAQLWAIVVFQNWWVNYFKA